MLKIEGIALTFDQPILSGIDLRIEEGSIVGFVGSSGSGKSSLLKIIAGYLQANTGLVYWNDEKVLGPHEQLIPGHPTIQLVNQDFKLDLFHTTRQNVIQSMLYLPNDVREVFADELLDLVELDKRAAIQARYLSGGEQQRLAIARALAAEPEVLLLDEPFSHLDAHLKHRIGNYIQVLSKERNMTCILVSHEGKDVMEWCELIHFIQEGKVTRTATPAQFWYTPSDYYEGVFFGELNEWIDEKGKKNYIRPSSIVSLNESGIAVQLLEERFIGTHWRFLLKLADKQQLIMYTTIHPQKIDYIGIRKEN